jgi:hypothetical protein
MKRKIKTAVAVSEDRRITRSQLSALGLGSDALFPLILQNTINSQKPKVAPETPKTGSKDRVHVIPADDENQVAKMSKFRSILSTADIETDLPIDTSPKGMRPIVLRRAVSHLEVDDKSWLSSSLIDLVISKLSRAYKNTYFMSIDFVVLSLSDENTTVAELQQATDILGRKVDYVKDKRPIVFVCNSHNIHWNLIRVLREPKPELQVFEPMGKPVNRHGGLGFRDVPRCVVRWLDMCCPLENGESWISTGVSAITNQQQFSSFDCGVACLLYAEKCGEGHTCEEINNSTCQQDLTEYRKVLQDFTRRLQNYENCLNSE